MNKNSKSALSGKGFYVALALSIAMVGAACYFAYTQTADNISGKLKSSVSSSEMEKEAADIMTDIPKVTVAPYTNEETVTETQPETESDEECEEREEQSQETAKPEEKNVFHAAGGGSAQRIQQRRTCEIKDHRRMADT